MSGLAAGVRFLLETGIHHIADHEGTLVTQFIEGANTIGGVVTHGPSEPGLRCGVVSFNVSGLPSSDVSQLLDREFSILSRSGLHCAPGAHRTIGTFPTGSVRFGFGPANTAEDVDAALTAVGQIADWAMEGDHHG